MDPAGRSQNLAPALKTLIGRYKKGTLRWREKGAGRRITDFRGRNVAALEKRQTSFTPKLQAELAARYEAGETVQELADAYHAGKGTIIRHLVHTGVQMRRQALTDMRAAEAKQLYGNGATIAEIATRLDAPFSTIRTALVRQGVTIRPRGRRRSDATD